MWIIPSTCSGWLSWNSSIATSAWWNGGSGRPASPAVKSLDTFDFPAIPSLNKALVIELARCEYVQHRENVIAVGNSDTGKTHMALGWAWPPARGGCRWASPRPSPWSTS